MFAPCMLEMQIALSAICIVLILTIFACSCTGIDLVLRTIREHLYSDDAAVSVIDIKRDTRLRMSV